MSADTEDTSEETSELGKIAEGLQAIARALDRLGVADAATPMGAIEVLAEQVRDGFEAPAAAMERVKTDA